jgi:hypothetical protein
MARWILQARVVQLRHRAGVGAAWRQPSGAPRQRPPAGAVMAGCLPVGAAPHRSFAPPQPVQLRRQRSSAVLQVPQIAVAVERLAVDAARPAAGVAGLWGARTGVVRPRPAAASMGLVESGSGRDGDLPGSARLPAAHQVSPPLAWLLGSDQPTTPAGTAQPEPYCARQPYSPTGAPAGHGLVGRRPDDAMPPRGRSRFLAQTSGRAAPFRVRVDPGWLACCSASRDAPCGTTTESLRHSQVSALRRWEDWTRSGRRLLAERVGQLADLWLRVGWVGLARASAVAGKVCPVLGFRLTRTRRAAP